MRLYIEDKEKDEIPPVEPGKVLEEDKGKVKLPVNPWENKEVPEDVKELVARDSVFMPAKEVSQIHGISVDAVRGIARDSEIVQDAKAITAMHKNNIQDLATAKLMQTLMILNPHDVEKERDKIGIITGLSKVLERYDEKGKNDKGNTVHLHLYSPNQKKEDAYPVIEVA